MRALLTSIASCIVLMTARTARAQPLLQETDISALTDDHFGQFAKNNPLEFLSLLHDIPAEQQKAYLKAVGSSIQQSTGAVCNIYGGQDSCMPIPADSGFARLCPEHDLKVDCAYWQESMAEANWDPLTQLRASLAAVQESDLEGACPECFENMRKYYCYALVPKCGSYAAQVEDAVLPAAADVVSAEDDGRSQIDALAAAVPRVVQAYSLSLPCRDMCVAITATCSCDRNFTFGEILDSYSNVLVGQPLPTGFSKQMFGALHNTEMCDIYSNSTMPGFAGHCEVLPTQCSNQQRWCEKVAGRADNPVFNATQEMLAGQVVEAVFGWMRDFTGQEASIVDEAGEQDVKVLEEKYLVPAAGAQGSGKSSASSHTILWVFVSMLALCIAALGVVAFFFVKSKRVVREPAYVALTESDSLLSPPTASLP